MPKTGYFFFERTNRTVVFAALVQLRERKNNSEKTSSIARLAGWISRSGFVELVQGSFCGVHPWPPVRDRRGVRVNSHFRLEHLIGPSFIKKNKERKRQDHLRSPGSTNSQKNSTILHPCSLLLSISSHVWVIMRSGAAAISCETLLHSHIASVQG